MKALSLALVLKFLAGGAAGLAAHESGHVIAAASFGAHPNTKSIHYAALPFFAITHDTVSRRQEFVISSAGFWMQHAGNEWLLTARPDLRRESAPFFKGVFAFNVITSGVYAAAAIGRFGPPERDPRGMALSLGRHGWPEPAIGALILGPAVLDTYRYFHPGHRWAVWTSRGLKAACTALVLFAGRPVA